MPYSYSPRIRVTGPAGLPVVYDVSAWQWVSRAVVSDGPLFSSQEMLDFTTEQTRYGSRRTVALDFEFPAGSESNETDMATILERALDDGWTIELSLDAGTTYRECVLASFDVEDLSGKKIGRAFRTTWIVKEIQTGPVAVLGGAW